MFDCCGGIPPRDREYIIQIGAQWDLSGPSAIDPAFVCDYANSIDPRDPTLIANAITFISWKESRGTWIQYTGLIYDGINVVGAPHLLPALCNTFTSADNQVWSSAYAVDIRNVPKCITTDKRKFGVSTRLTCTRYDAPTSIKIVAVPLPASELFTFQDATVYASGFPTCCNPAP